MYWSWKAERQTSKKACWWITIVTTSSKLMDAKMYCTGRHHGRLQSLRLYRLKESYLKRKNTSYSEKIRFFGHRNSEEIGMVTRTYNTEKRIYVHNFLLVATPYCTHQLYLNELPPHPLQFFVSVPIFKSFLSTSSYTSIFQIGIFELDFQQL